MSSEDEIEKLRARIIEIEDLMLTHSRLFKSAMERATSEAREKRAYRKIAVDLHRRYECADAEQGCDKLIDARATHIMDQDEPIRETE